MPLAVTNASISPAITRFTGKHAFLSNSFHAPFAFEATIYPTAEHAFQAARFASPSIKLSICQATTAGKAKKVSEAFSEVVPDWDTKRVPVMRKILDAKFQNSRALRLLLLQTWPVDLIDAQDGDQFWGQMAGVGENRLGKLLMHLRARLRKA